MTDAASSTPRYSIVSAVYNVGRYLDEFIRSVEKQTFGLDRLEVIMVNDGSTDNSLEILEKWQQRRPELVTIVTKENGGLPSARNAGLPFVHGEWVTFTDPDDILDRKFFAQVEAFLDKRPQTVMVGTRRMVFSDRTGEKLRHALDAHFVPGSDRMRNLDYDTGHFHGHAASTFFRTDLIRREDLTFDERLRATFEDGHFCNKYLLRADEPLVGYVASAEYNYRLRDDGTSQLDRSWANPGRFIDVFEHGYLDLLRDGVERRGRAPSWLQGMVIYELYWYFRQNERTASPTAAHGETQKRFHELMREVTELLDETGIQTYSATGFTSTWRDILLHGYDEQSWHTSFGIINKMDAAQQLVRVTYRFVGPLPEETFVVYGKPVEPVHQKIRDVKLFDKTMLQERIVWLPFGTTRVLLDGQDIDLRMSEPDMPRHRLLGFHIEKALDPNAPKASSASSLTFAEHVTRRLSRTALVRLYFRDAWILIDRIFNADDSAEHLFHYLRKHRRSVNAWFVIESGTRDYRRLRRKAGHRVLAHGSWRWKLAMLNAQHLISSHIDDVIVKPKEVTKLRKPRWRVTFLQHGVMKDDLSVWLNRKNIDVFVTSTRAEYESVVADHTTYRYTTREAKLTGLPRFDRILAAGNKVKPDQRDLILVAPTWREWLSTPQPQGGVGRFVVDPARFAASDYAINWTALVNSRDLRELAERTGSKVAVLLHPNFQGAATLKTDPHVELLSFEGQNIQEHFARAKVLITDYSSMFFNAAYIERPIVYFQFDHDRVVGGGHLGRKGYFEYERDGFGPVAYDVDAAVASVVKAVENGPEPEQPYLERIRTAFPERDGRCCERVADAIIDSTRDASKPSKASRPLSRRIASRGRRELRRVVKRAQRSRAAA